MTVGCIIQARMGSTRLSGKVMKLIDEYSQLYFVINQIQYCKNINKIVIATTDFSEDNIIENFSYIQGLDSFRGSSADVLDRYYKCAKKYSFSTIVRITSDNPLIDPTIVDKVILKFNEGSYDYVSNCHPKTFPHGTETEVFSFEILEKIWKLAKESYDREHVTPYIYKNRDKFCIFNLEHDEDLSHLSWTVDTLKDFERVQKIVSKIQKRPILMDDILEVISTEPTLFEK